MGFNSGFKGLRLFLIDHSKNGALAGRYAASRAL